MVPVVLGDGVTLGATTDKGGRHHRGSREVLDREGVYVLAAESARSTLIDAGMRHPIVRPGLEPFPLFAACKIVPANAVAFIHVVVQKAMNLSLLRVPSMMGPPGAR